MDSTRQPRMIDTQPEALYEDLRNTAANERVSVADYDNSYEALALKQAFEFGANTAKQFPDKYVRLLQMVTAGRRWALKEKSHTRMVAVGKIAAGFTTIDLRVDTSGNDIAVAEGLPEWSPKPKPGPSEPDHDLIRKQKIEDEL